MSKALLVNTDTSSQNKAGVEKTTPAKTHRLLQPWQTTKQLLLSASFIGCFWGNLPAVVLADALPQRINFQHLLENKDIVLGEVAAIIQDSQGFMWFGGANALIRYDGYNFKSVPITEQGDNGPEELPVKTVFDIIEDSDKTLWISTRTGLLRYNPRTELLTRIPDDPSAGVPITSSDIVQAMEIPSGELLLSSRSGLFVVNRKTGTYTVTVNNATGCTASATQSLDVGTYLLPVIATTATGCNGTATLDAGTGYASYLWSDGSTAQILQVNANGTYSVTVSDGTGCTGEDAVSVSLPVSPQVQISGVSSICQGSSTQFSVPNGFAQILWSTGAATPVITVSQPAVYGVTVTDANGCTASAYQSLTVGPGLLPDISVMLTSCDGTSSLDVGGGFATYLWSNGSTAPAITVSANGTYSVTVSDASGCTGTASENVVLPNPPTVQVVGAASLCQGDQTVLAAPGNFTQYLWSTGETTPQITIFQGGLYSVTVSDANGCMASADWTVAQLLTNLVTLQASACSPQDTGTVQMVFTNQSGCDSVVVTVISLAPPILKPR